MFLEIISSPCNAHSSNAYKTFVSYLAPEFDNQRVNALPYSSGVPYRFRLTDTTVNVKTVIVNGVDKYTFTDDTFEFELYPGYGGGPTEVYVKDENGVESNRRILYVYNLHTLIAIAMQEATTQDEEMYQAVADQYLEDIGVTDYDGTVYVPSLKGLHENYGKLLKTYRLSGESRAFYQARLQQLWGAYRNAGTVQAFEAVVSGFSPTGDTDIYTYAERRELNLSRLGRYQRIAPLTLAVYPNRLKVGIRWHNITYTEVSVGASGETYVYVDGDVDATGNLVIKTSTTEPMPFIRTVVESFASNEIQEDTSEDENAGMLVTMFVGGKYVLLTYYPEEIVDATSAAGANFEFAEMVENEYGVFPLTAGTPLLDLRTTLPADAFAPVTVTYTTRVRPIVLCRVTATTDITDIERPIPSEGAIARTMQEEWSHYEVFISDATFNTDEKEMIVQTLSQMSPAAATCDVFFGDPTFRSDPYRYHYDGYTFYKSF